ncbi:MAG TPA: LuxR C-terminal-related transcriptional regulator [Pilimelia sp.]|nr:LuxR C-terminal-related transcriptional regulator [Pilimelia sp.]
MVGTIADQEKIQQPMRPPGTVRRGRLLRDLKTTADQVPLVVVSAPAGYGKTTALSAWSAEDPRPFAWVNLDDADNDPIRLLYHVALAVNVVRPFESGVWRDLESARASGAGAVVSRLLACIASAPPWVLVLDDAHALRPGPGPDVIVGLANGAPAGCQVVISGRNRTALRVGGLRSRGMCFEVGPRELAFSQDEAEVVMTTAGIHLSSEALATLLDRLDGWPAGIYLAALSLRDSPNPDATAGEIAGSAAFIVDYLREEVLLRESPETAQFLVRTAPLGHLSGALCDAVLGSEGSAARLADLESRGLFVVPVDSDRAWYRYQPLFAEMLVAELRLREPAEETRTHLRAAAWYEEQGLGEAAISHAIAGEDRVTAARLVATYAEPYLNTGRLLTVGDWLRSLADATESYPPLPGIAGWIWALSGDAARAQECLLAAERALLADEEGEWVDVPSSGLPSLVSGFVLLRAGLAPYGVEQMLVDARKALDLEPPGRVYHPVASALVGIAEMLNGDLAAATVALERAAHFARERQRMMASVALAELSLIAAEQHDWIAAESCAAEALAIIEAGNLADYPTSTAAYVAMAKAAVHRRDAREARRYTDDALRRYARPSPAALPWFAAQIGIALGRVLFDLDDYPATRRKVFEVRRHLARLSVHGVLGTQHRQLVRDIARHSRDPGPSGVLTITPAETRVLRLLPTHLTLTEIADALFVSRNTVKTQVASLYGKLTAANRDEAVRTAKDLGLID